MYENKHIINDTIRLLNENKISKEGAVEIFDKYASTEMKFNFGMASEEEKNFDQAFMWMELASKDGFPEAIFNLARYYFEGRGCDKDIAKSFELWTASAHKGHVSSIFNLSFFYLHGWHVRRDLEKAIELLLEAAKNGHNNAKLNLGKIYWLSIKNYQKAQNFLLDAASSDVVEAQYSLGMLLADEKNPEKNLEKARHWLTVAALKDMPEALHNLGVMYHGGKGGEKNILVARDLWVRASLEGFRPSQGACYGMPGVAKLFTTGVAPVELILSMYKEFDEPRIE